MLKCIILLISLFTNSIFAFRTNTRSKLGSKLYSSSVVAPIKEVIWDRKSWESGYVSCPKETAEVIGDVPLLLKGTYFLNGPGTGRYTFFFL